MSINLMFRALQHPVEGELVSGGGEGPQDIRTRCHSQGNIGSK